MVRADGVSYAYGQPLAGFGLQLPDAPHGAGAGGSEAGDKNNSNNNNNSNGSSNSGSVRLGRRQPGDNDDDHSPGGYGSGDSDSDYLPASASVAAGLAEDSPRSQLSPAERMKSLLRRTLSDASTPPAQGGQYPGARGALVPMPASPPASAGVVIIPPEVMASSSFDPEPLYPREASASPGQRAPGAMLAGSRGSAASGLRPSGVPPILRFPSLTAVAATLPVALPTARSPASLGAPAASQRLLPTPSMTTVRCWCCCTILGVCVSADGTVFLAFYNRHP